MPPPPFSNVHNPHSQQNHHLTDDHVPLPPPPGEIVIKNHHYNGLINTLIPSWVPSSYLEKGKNYFKLKKI